jgi:hypothetical protein
MVSKYHDLDARVIQTIPNTGVAYNVDWPNLKEIHQISFVGSRFYANREKQFQDIEKSGIHIESFGFGWPSGYISFEEMIDIFQTSKINLNFSSGSPVEGDVLQIKGRVFQVCMAGGFLLTEYTSGLEKYFVLDKEIVCFRTQEEMAKKISYYLNHDQERLTIARAGWEKACRDYTSIAMTAKVFEEIENDHLKPHTKPTELHVPVRIRGQMASYYMDWYAAFQNEMKTRLAKESFWMAIRNYPIAISPEWWGAHIISVLPKPLRNIARKCYQLLKRMHRLIKKLLTSGNSAK